MGRAAAKTKKKKKKDQWKRRDASTGFSRLEPGQPMRSSEKAGEEKHHRTASHDPISLLNYMGRRKKNRERGVKCIYPKG